MAILAALPDHLVGCERFFTALQNERTPDGFRLVLSRFVRVVCDESNHCGLTMSKLEDVVDSIRQHLRFAVRPRMPTQMLPDEFNYDEGGVGKDDRSGYAWRWLPVQVPWVAQDAVRRPQFPMPIYCLIGSAMGSYRYLWSITALWHLDSSFATAPLASSFAFALLDVVTGAPPTMVLSAVVLWAFCLRGVF